MEGGIEAVCVGQSGALWLLNLCFTNAKAMLY